MRHNRLPTVDPTVATTRPTARALAGMTFLLLVALGLQLALLHGPLDDLAREDASLILVASFLAGVLGMSFLRPVAGALIVCLGFLLNALVVLVNRGMPVSPDAAATLGLEGRLAHTSGVHELAGAQTSLDWLGDVIPVPPLGQVLSVGDVVIGIGLAVVAISATLRLYPRTGGQISPNEYLRRSPIAARAVHGISLTSHDAEEGESA